MGCDTDTESVEEVEDNKVKMKVMQSVYDFFDIQVQHDEDNKKTTYRKFLE